MTWLLKLLSFSLLAGAAAPNARYFISHCTIYNSKFETVRVLTGYYCAPHPDGSWTAVNRNGITHYSSSGDVQWELAGNFHHQIEFVSGNVLALGKEIKNFQGLNIAADSVIKLAPNSGKVLAKFRLDESILDFGKIEKAARKLAKGTRSLWLIPDFAANAFSYKGVDVEISHINAIYPIPPEQLGVTNGGKYVVTDNLAALCFAIDENFKLTGWAYRPKPPVDQLFSPGLHDCQLLKDGSILYFENYSDVGSYPSYKVIRTTAEDVVLFQFPTSQQDFFKAPFRGSVELIDEGYLISANNEDSTDGFFGIVSPKGQWLAKKSLPTAQQEIKVMPFNDFIKKNNLR